MPSLAIIRFYKIEMPECLEIPIDFEALLLATMNLPEPERTVSIKGFPIRLLTLKSVENYRGNQVIEGEIIRIRMKGLSVVAGVDSGVEDLEIDQDKGLGTETAFLYHPKTETLVLHNVQNGVSISAFLAYFESINNSKIQAFSGDISADPIINRETMASFKKINEFKSVRFKVAKVENEDFIREISSSQKELISALTQYNAYFVETEVKVGIKRSNKLDGGECTRTVMDLLQLHSRQNESVETIKITGKSVDDEKIEIVNLLADLIKEEIRYNKDDLRNIPYQMRRDAVRKAWTKRKDEIISMLQPSVE
jgi:hypothetical protein